MNIRSMMEMMGTLDATNQSSEAAIAEFIINRLCGYRSNSVAKPNDKAFIVAAIQAYALMLQEHDVKVIA